MLPIDQVGELLGLIAEDKKISFDREYAETLYRKYNESKVVDDSSVIDDLKNEFAGKRILLVAPGKNIGNAFNRIKEISMQEDVISIGLNSTIDIKFDYILTTRADIYTQVVADGKNVIVPSNVSKGGRGNVKVLNYVNWIEVDEITHDSSSVIALKLLQACGIKSILLAGFDGFSSNINDNYYDTSMRRPVTVEQAERRNAYYKSLIGRMINNGVNIVFITPSKYE